MNQNARKTVKTKVEKDFYKLLNNSNFGNDCRNNIGNCTLELLYDGPEELAYIQKFTNVLQDARCKFFTIDLFKKQVEDDFEKKLEQLDVNDEFYPALLENLTEEKNEKLEVIDAYGKSKKRKYPFYSIQKKLNFIEQQIEDSIDLRKNRMTIEFNDSECSSIKHIAVKSNTSIKCTTRFMSGKLLMFAKLSLKSFIYSLIELLSFPEQNSLIQEIYNRYQIEKILIYHILTDTDSTSLQFLVISHVQSTFTEEQVRNILFEIFSENEIRDSFDKSDKFWEQFGICKPENQKVLCLYDVESINDPCLVTLAVNPKEYYEYFKSENVNKKHKGIKKGSAGMDYENFAERIKPLFKFESYKKPKKDTKPVVRISFKKGEMTTYQIVKYKFSQLNEKRFYFPNAIISLPFGHQALNELDELKKNKGQRIENYFLQERRAFRT